MHNVRFFSHLTKVWVSEKSYQKLKRGVFNKNPGLDIAAYGYGYTYVEEKLSEFRLRVVYYSEGLGMAGLCSVILKVESVK